MYFSGKILVNYLLRYVLIMPSCHALFLDQAIRAKLQVEPASSQEPTF